MTDNPAGAPRYDLFNISLTAPAIFSVDFTKGGMAINGITEIVGATIALAIGVWLTGTRATRVETRQGGRLVKQEFHPATEGTAQNDFSHFVGNTLKLAE